MRIRSGCRGHSAELIGFDGCLRTVRIARFGRNGVPQGAAACDDEGDAYKTTMTLITVSAAEAADDDVRCAGMRPRRSFGCLSAIHSRCSRATGCLLCSMSLMSVGSSRLAAALSVFCYMETFNDERVQLISFSVICNKDATVRRFPIWSL
jgi:hypothetical protein